MYLSFLPGQIYHVYNRGNYRENIFLEDRNYHYFMTLYQKYLTPVVDTFAFNLLPGHFHLGIRAKDEADLVGQKPIHQCFSNMLNAYTKSMNKMYGRRGSLFEKHLKRKLVTSDAYLRTLILYIHRNPENHGLIRDFRTWPYSSYHHISAQEGGLVRSAWVLDWFDGMEGFLEAHSRPTPDLAGLG